MRNGSTERAQKDHEPRVRRLIDGLMEQLREIAKSGQETDIADWNNLIAYDIVAYLATGENSKGVENGKHYKW